MQPRFKRVTPLTIFSLLGYHTSIFCFSFQNKFIYLCEFSYVGIIYLWHKNYCNYSGEAKTYELFLIRLFDIEVFISPIVCILHDRSTKVFTTNYTWLQSCIFLLNYWHHFITSHQDVCLNQYCFNVIKSCNACCGLILFITIS